MKEHFSALPPAPSPPLPQYSAEAKTPYVQIAHVLFMDVVGFGRFPMAAQGGVLAANQYKPVLTRVMPPLRIWVGSDFDADILAGTGWEETQEGANVELAYAKDDPWRVHRQEKEVPMVSPWRAWLEIAAIKGRTEELASALFTELSEAS